MRCAGTGLPIGWEIVCACLRVRGRRARSFSRWPRFLSRRAGCIAQTRVPKYAMVLGKLHYWWLAWWWWPLLVRPTGRPPCHEPKGGTNEQLERSGRTSAYVDTSHVQVRLSRRTVVCILLRFILLDVLASLLLARALFSYRIKTLHTVTSNV